jgi:PAS domain S-box-containing protein
MLRANEGIWIIDDRGNTVYANHRMGQILGAAPEELLGRSSFDFVFPEDLDDAQRLFAARQRGEYEPFQFRLRRKDGSCTNVRVQGTPLRNASGEFSGVVGTFTVAA